MTRSAVSRVVARWCAGAVLALAACTRHDDSASQNRSILHFDTASVRLASSKDTSRLVTELASTEDQHTVGLMERYRMPDSAGMLFLYTTMQPDTSAFWMYRTRIPLDIAFIDSAGVIKTIRHMVPCTTTMPQGCQTYPAGARYQYALEVNASYFARHRIAEGDRVMLGDTARRVSAAPNPR